MSIGMGSVPSVGGGDVERFESDLAHDDPCKCEGLAGGKVVEVGKHKEVPSVEACHVEWFMYPKHGVDGGSSVHYAIKN